ncbi:hypothetical protein RFI_09322 [Reticulomyxa filosa]|uniref:SEC7 domain-containing protein n=1 Tax=Reticulomyxa filosa TaxID=46433 RepID=X6NP62_RETFI|nr:hypothetical protein RFI_09322 [Reticulomyxa filosa]|eukprot:ETO27811.1 hypothetical protein RFI_09322 [Reticulomyxa filosa]
MHEYIDSLDFKDLELDEAVRKLCSNFKLPGEGQKIDRIMQKFAERYCLQNEESFQQADDAYILAYSIIMLNVNLYNRNVKTHMTKEEFVKNTMLAVTDSSMSKSIELIYDRIAANEILLNDHAPNGSSKSGPLGNLTNPAGEAVANALAFFNGMYNSHSSEFQPSQPNFLQQRKNIMARVHDEVSNVTSAVKSKKSREENMFYEPQPVAYFSFSFFSICLICFFKKKNYILYFIEDAEALQPMFRICWLASLATFSVLLEDPQANMLNQLHSLASGLGKQVQSGKVASEQLVGLCLSGYRHGVKLATRLQMDIEAEAYINSLANLTLLGTDKPIDQKNIDAIKTLIEIASEDGNMLRGSWFQILKCISEIEVLHLIKSEEVVDAAHFMNDQERAQISNVHTSSGSSLSRSYKTKLIQEHTKFTSKGVLRFSGEYANAAMVASQIPSSAVDRVFMDSTKLDNESIVHFCIALATVSAVELDNPLNPRVFSLRKIVEVAHDNIHIRIPLIWQRVWNVLSRHFVKAGLHRNRNIGEYCINSLRQLAGLFFEKEELTNFQFQSKFLLPFHQIMEQSKSQPVRLLIIECIFSIVKTRFTNVKSGWKTVFSVVALAAKDSDETLVLKTYDVMGSILGDYFPLLQYKSGAPPSETTENKTSVKKVRSFPIHLVGAETLEECVNCLVAFAGCPFANIALKAIDTLVVCASQLYDLDQTIKHTKDESKDHNKEQAGPSQDEKSEPTSHPVFLLKRSSKDFLPEKESPMLKAWFLCLTGLSRIIFDDRHTVFGLASRNIVGCFLSDFVYCFFVCFFFF